MYSVPPSGLSAGLAAMGVLLAGTKVHTTAPVAASKAVTWGVRLATMTSVCPGTAGLAASSTTPGTAPCTGDFHTRAPVGLTLYTVPSVGVLVLGLVSVLAA